MENDENIIEKSIKKEITKRSWTFDDFSDLNNIIQDITEKMYDKIKAKDKLDLVWDKDIEDGLTFGQFFQGVVKQGLKEKIAEELKDLLKGASVVFIGDENENEISKRSLGGKSYKERPSNEKDNSKK
jgi:hypothetical protein|tara:strand:- start:805 stop:1188 length:384 start_codon:yes stop_codon:yes gene_type:complete